MCYVSQAHTQTQRGKDSQDIGTPTHRLRFHLVLHFTSLQFSSVHSIFPVLADWPLELRAYINADRQGTPDPRKTPWIAQKPLPFGPSVLCARLAVSLSVKSQTRHSRRQRYGQGHAAAASPPTPIENLQAPAPAHLTIAMTDI